MSTTLGEKNALTKTFPAELDRLYEMLKFIKDYSSSLGFPGSQLLKIEVAMEEAIVNVISYGYPNGKKGTIQITCGMLDEGAVKVTLKDRGVPYNPVESLQKGDQPDDDKLGGYGVKLIVEIMDQVSYTRQAGCNILSLIKYRSV